MASFLDSLSASNPFNPANPVFGKGGFVNRTGDALRQGGGNVLNSILGGQGIGSQFLQRLSGVDAIPTGTSPETILALQQEMIARGVPQGEMDRLTTLFQQKDENGNPYYTPGDIMQMAQQSIQSGQVGDLNEQIQQQIATQQGQIDADRTAGLADLGKVENYATGRRDYFGGLASDPNALRGSAEFGQLLGAVENSNIAGENQARRESGERVAARGSGFSSAGLDQAMQARGQSLYNRTNALGTARGQAAGAQGLYENILSGIPGAKQNVRTGAQSSQQALTGLLGGLGGNLYGQGAGLSPNYSEAYGNSLGVGDYNRGQQQQAGGQAFQLGTYPLNLASNFGGQVMNSQLPKWIMGGLS